jgi:putative ABC transport system substrate-binding protein
LTFISIESTIKLNNLGGVYMKKILSLALFFTLSATLLTGCGASGNATAGSADSGSESAESAELADTNGKTLQIGVIQYTEHPALDSAREGFVEGLKDAGYVDGQNVSIEVQNAQADQSNLKTIAQKFAADNKDLVLAIATPAAQSMAAETKDIPILITAVTDPASSDLVASNDKPDCNVSGTSDMNPVKEQIELLQKLVPDAKKIAIMYCSGEQNSVIQANMAAEAAKELGIESENKTVTSTNDVAQVTESLIGNYDAVYIPTDNVLASSMPLVSSITNPKGLPVIVGEQGMVEGGGLASIAIDYKELGKITGSMAAEIFGGADITTMPIRYTENPELIVNEVAAEELGVTIPDDIKSTATVVNTTTEETTN